MTQKIMLPMAASAKRDYAVTCKEQSALAGRYGIKLADVRDRMFELSELMASGEIQPQKTGNKTKLVINSYIESSNAIGRQGALANGPQVGLHPTNRDTV
jgi:hypothetical protein